MNLYTKYGQGQPMEEFLRQYGSEAHQQRWHYTQETTTLTDAQRTILASFKREMHVLVLAGAWCGDCSSQCPIFECFAAVAPVIHTRYLDRDEHADVQQALKINGGNRVPVLVFFSEDGFEVARYGERTLSRYRQLVAELTGAGCATGLGLRGDSIHAQVVQDWLNEFERVQYILRLSPRLRQKHRD